MPVGSPDDVKDDYRQNGDTYLGYYAQIVARYKEISPVFDDRVHEQYYMYGHMNPSGYILIAELVDSYIDYIVKHNPKDF